MRIAYVLQSRFPTEKVYGFQVAQVCHALAGNGHAVTLLCPTTAHTVHESPFSYYGIPESFTVEYLPSFDALQAPWVPGPLAFLFSMRSYGKALRRRIVADRSDLLYLRSPVLLAAALATGVPVILELHTLPRVGRSAFVRHCNACTLVVCLTSAQRAVLLAWGVEERRILVEPDGVDLARFRVLPAAPASRARWHLPPDRPIIGYAGSLVTQEALEKGVDVLVRALAMLKSRGYSACGWIVGGPRAWVERYRTLAGSLGLTEDDCRFQGPVRAVEIPSALAACDVLVYPAPASSHPYYLRDTSPLKLLEYAAARKPVVGAAIPAIADLFDASCGFPVPPGNPAALADHIAFVLAHPDDAARRMGAFAARVARHDWSERMRRILVSATV